ncbi:hypothetical protein [Chryseobacterium gallinarum]|uniref:DNA-binding protein n=1 Tax=Chryseobacterium gallinarum TaxID=1324352 RepID=A0ABX6KUI5_CHRGL|nr:hypothetical protein [Chryseobacterium gallinarum]QIY92215.1 hypothetical protein FOB44_16785 [Chryseobacterium gallinarum]
MEKTIKERILNLLNLKEKEEIAQEIANVLDDYKSDLLQSLEREYIFREYETVEYVSNGWFITPPSKGEFYITKDAIYEVLQVTHSYNSSKEAGTIQVKKVRELKVGHL